MSAPTGVARAQAQCAPSCARYRSPFSLENVNGLPRPFCAAFPDGIPDDIWTNQFDHRQPHEGDHGLRWQAKPGYRFPASAFAPGILGQMDQTITAAADVANRAMIALVPSQADATRLAMSGGEPTDQIHCTLIYLGDAAALDDSARAALRAWCDSMGNGQAGWDSIEADGFGAALFNPTGEEPCAAVLLSGAELAEFYEMTQADVSDLGLVPPDAHAPWIPHLTLAHVPVGADAMPALEQVASRVGPVIFDRLRLAVAGDVYDVPIGADHQTPAPDAVPEPEAAVTVELDAPDGPAVTAAGKSEREVFEGCLRCFGPIHDGPCPPAL